MKTFYKAVVTEKTSPLFGKILASTKGSLKYSEMSKEEFRLAIEDNQCYAFEVIEF